MKRCLTLIIVVFCIQLHAQEAVIGQPLPLWKEGYLDLHHINTGRGSSAWYIFPDGTTMLVDAGEMNPENERTKSPRNSVIRPDSSKRPYEWIVHYIQTHSPSKQDLRLDYALITHFHDDHFGCWYSTAPLSATGKYKLAGITGVGELIPVRQLFDRGYPDYNYPVDISTQMKKLNSTDSFGYRSLQNYKNFVSAQKEKGMQTALFKAGSNRQITLQYKPKQFPDFYVQNVKANGLIWTGKDSSTLQHFTAIDVNDPKTWPDENTLSLALVIHYGPFSYYTGGDNPGNVFYGEPAWRDVETPMARSIGEVDIATMDHHGNRDAVNENMVKAFKPRVWIGQSWSSDHPGHEVLLRMTTPFLYPGDRDLFATNMLEANKNVIGPLIDRSYKSQQGHIVVRVLPGGKTYYVIILDDSKTDLPVKSVFGPYTSKTQQAQHEQPQLLKEPANWEFERFALPPAFAPGIHHKGAEELRFAPGMFRKDTATYFTYAFVAQLDNTTAISQNEISDYLLKYYKGLCSAVAGDRKLVIDTNKITVRTEKKATAANETIYNAAINLFGVFTDGAPVKLNMEIKVMINTTAKKTYLVMITSPRDKKDPVWKDLYLIQKKFTIPG